MPNLTIHPYTPVSGVSYDGHTAQYNYTVRISKGTIASKAVLHATNAYASHLLPLLQGSAGVFGVRCHVMAVQPNLPNAPQLRPGFGYDDMWHWLVQRNDGGPFIHGYSSCEWIGDYDDSLTMPDDHPLRADMVQFLERMFLKHFNQLQLKGDALYDWTGIQEFTPDGASIVGRPYADRKGEFVAVAFNGEGMTRCVSCATAVTDALIHYLHGEDERWTPPTWLPESFRCNV